MKIMDTAEKLVEAICQSREQRLSRREFFGSLVPWTRKQCKVCGDSHMTKTDLCPTCAKRHLAT